MDDTVATAGADVEPPVSIEFTGRRGALFKLVLKNVLLNIATVGIFRFWGKTRVRRFFWSNIVIGGEPLEYAGRGVELLIGFLIVLAVLIPLSLIAAALRQLVGIGWALPLVNILYFAVFLFLVQFAVFRVWRYRLARTLWRGIRFGLDGSALPYAVRAFGWWIARILTLGIIHPWASVNLMRYKVRRVRFGDTNFDFDGSGRKLIGPWLVAWLVPGSIMVSGIVAFQYLTLKMAPVLVKGAHLPSDIAGAIGLAIMAAWVGAATFLLFFAWYRIRELRYFASCTRFGNATFAAAAKAWAVIGPLLLAGVIFLIGFILLSTVLVGVFTSLIVSGTANGMNIHAFTPIIGIVFTLLVLLLTPVVTYPIVVFPIIRHVWTTLTVSDAQAFEGAVQATGEGPRFGEGLADALDVGAI